MTFMKYVLCTLFIPLVTNSVVNADIADLNEEDLAPKFSIFGHTGQDPAPHRSFGWHENPTEFNVRIADSVDQSKKYVVIFTPLDVSIFIEDNINIPTELGELLPISVDTSRGSPTLDLPSHGGIPAPPTMFLLVCGLSRKRRKGS